MSCNYPGIHHASHLKSYLYHDLCGSSSINIKAIDRSLCTYLRNPRGFCMLRCPTLDSFVSRAQQNFLSKVYSYLFGLSLSSWGHCRQWPQKKEQMAIQSHQWRMHPMTTMVHLFSIGANGYRHWRHWRSPLQSPLVPFKWRHKIVMLHSPFKGRGAIGDKYVIIHQWCR